MAYARTKMERVSDNSTSLLILKSLAMDVSAGATIDDETGDMKVNEDTTIGQ